MPRSTLLCRAEWRIALAGPRRSRRRARSCHRPGRGARWAWRPAPWDRAARRWQRCPWLKQSARWHQLVPDDRSDSVCARLNQTDPRAVVQRAAALVWAARHSRAADTAARRRASRARQDTSARDKRASPACYTAARSRAEHRPAADHIVVADMPALVAEDKRAVADTADNRRRADCHTWAARAARVAAALKVQPSALLPGATLRLARHAAPDATSMSARPWAARWESQRRELSARARL